MKHNIVISSRIRLARNLSGIPFRSKMTEEQQNQLKQSVKDAIKEDRAHTYNYLDMQNVSNIQAGSMVEDHLISLEFANHRNGAGLLLSRTKDISVMINEEDHLRMQAIGKGYCLQELYKKLDTLDDILDEKLHFAFSEQYGYLTACPSNLGTALRASVMIHLPALTKQGLMNNIVQAVTRLGMTVRGLYGEGTQPGGAIYQISNQVTLGITEQETLERLDDIISQIADAEEKARKKLQKELSVQDEIFRSLGTLRYARVLSSMEFINHSSNVRMGVEMGLIPFQTEQLDALFNKVQPYNLMLTGGENLDVQQRDVRRADLVREAYDDIFKQE